MPKVLHLRAPFNGMGSAGFFGTAIAPSCCGRAQFAAKEFLVMENGTLSEQANLRSLTRSTINPCQFLAQF
jgi:hypothetical protein